MSWFVRAIASLATACTHCTMHEDEHEKEFKTNKRPNQDNEIQILEYEKSIYASDRENTD